MPEAKTKALERKKNESDTDNGCAKCGKGMSHAMHKNDEHPKYHKFANNDSSKEKGDEEEGKKEKKEEE
jgi:hypothetical protein